MIIVEGPDGSGKSTLVQKLYRELNANGLPIEIGTRSVTDRDRLYQSTVTDTFRAIRNAVDSHNPPFIWDRLFFSEFVYSEAVQGRPMQFNRRQVTQVMRFLYANRTPIIWCMPHIELVRMNVEGEGHQMEGVEDRTDVIYRAYQVMMWMTSDLNAWSFDYTNQFDFEQTVSKLAQYIKVKGETP